MTRYATAAVVTAALIVGGFAASTGRADDPVAPITVTATVTRTEPQRYRGRTAASWAREARQRHRDSDARGRTVKRLRRAARARWAPSVDYALRLASVVYSVPLSQLRAVAWCESRFDVYARNGRYRSVFQEGPMFERGPFGRAGFSVWDPLANSLTAAYTMHREGFGQWQCKP